jgi:hypothetical protein
MRSTLDGGSEAQSQQSLKRLAGLPTWRRMLRNLAAIAFGLLIGLVIAEIALRLFGYSSPTFLRRHPVFGWHYKPNAEGWQRMEGEAWIEINDRGFRDAPRSFEKPPGTYRIAVLGDSYTAAEQVDVERRFGEIAERILNNRDGSGMRKVEVLNFGCSGYGTAQQLLVWRHEARKYEADLVLLAFMSGNDLANNSHELDQQPRPFFTLQGEQLVLDDSFRESNHYRSRMNFTARIVYWLLDHSRLAQLLNTARIQGNNQRIAAQPDQLEEAGLNAEVYQEPQNDAWRRAWLLTEALLAQLNEEVQATGAKFCVVTLSNSSQDSPNEQRRTDFMKRLDVEDLFFPDRRVAAFCADHSIPCLTLAPALLAIAQETGKPLHGFESNLDYGHWNEHGHEAAGKLIADWVARSFLDSE